MENNRVEYWAGMIIPEYMSYDWLTVWRKKALKAEEDNNVLIVIEIPSTGKSDTIQQIETFLQEKFNLLK